jgi:hypothetical protein
MVIASVFFEGDDDDASLLVCPAPTMAGLLAQVCKNFSFIFTPTKKGLKGVRRMGWTIKIFDAAGQRLSAASYHKAAAREELIVRCSKKIKL